MQAEVKRSDLLAAVIAASQTTDPSGTMPILSNLLLGCESGQLRISSTNRHQSTRCAIPANGDKFRVAVNARGLLGRVKATEGETIVLSHADDTGEVTLKCGRRKFSMLSMFAEDFPTIHEAKGDPVIIDAAKLSAAVASVAHSISTDFTRPHLYSLLLEFGGGTLKAVATNGHGMSLRTVAHDGPTATALVPLPGVVALRRLIEPGGSVSLTMDGTYVTAEREGVSLTTVLTGAQFPPYQQVIPKDHGREVIVNAEEMKRVVAALAVTGGETMGSTDKSKSKDAVPMVLLKATGDEIELTTRNDNGEHSTDFLPCEDCGEWQVKMQSRYLTDALDGAGTESVTLGISGELDPVVFKNDEGYLQILMPVRI